MNDTPDRPEPPEEIQLPDNIVECYNCSGYKDVDDPENRDIPHELDLCTCDDALKRDAAAVAFIHEGGAMTDHYPAVSPDMLLVVRRSTNETSHHGLWELPGGKVEDGKTILQTAFDELHEETGINPHDIECDECNLYITNGNHASVYVADEIFTHETEDKRYHVVKMLFDSAPRPAVILSDEHDEYGWFSVAELLRMNPDKLSHHLYSLIMTEFRTAETGIGPATPVKVTLAKHDEEE